MRSILFLLCSVSLALTATGKVISKPIRDTASRRYIYMEDEHGGIKLVDLKNGTITRQAELADVTYYLYTIKNSENPYIIYNGDVLSLELSMFNPSNPSVFISHGWNNDHTSPVNTLITAAILEKYDINVFVVDWNGPANSNYLTAMDAVPFVGQFEAQFIEGIQQTYQLTGNDFILIGHSLGAHVAGCAGAALGSFVKVIIGLDPAGPLFTAGYLDNRIDKTDGQFVHVIHTSALLGWDSPLGHADYFPNGGMSQPGCGLDLAETCAHGRSYRYLAESIQRGNSAFLSTKCANYDDFENGLCSNNEQSPMGGLEIDQIASGEFYLYTNTDEPYGLGGH